MANVFSKLFFLVFIVSFIEVIATPHRAVPQFNKVMIVIFENADFQDVVNQPFFKKLGTEGALLTNFHAETHPSQPNYIALISGSTQGCKNDSNINIDAPNLADLLEEKGKTWKVYAESYPGNCFKGATSGTYVRKHNPFISFKSIQNDPERCSHIVDASELQNDIDNNTLPTFSFYVPDLNNDGHDTSPKFADNWYSQTFGPHLKNPHFIEGMLLVSTFDESSLLEPTNRIYTSFYGEGIRPNSSTAEKYTHYNLLRTIEDNFALEPMTSNDKNAKAVTGIWKQ
jgi:hypothetical protein